MNACTICNPRNCVMLPKDSMLFSKIHFMHTIPRGEFDLYMNILGSKFVNANQYLESRQYYVLEKYSASRPCTGERSQRHVFTVFLTLRTQSGATV